MIYPEVNQEVLNTIATLSESINSIRNGLKTRIEQHYPEWVVDTAEGILTRAQIMAKSIYKALDVAKITYDGKAGGYTLEVPYEDILAFGKTPSDVDTHLKESISILFGNTISEIKSSGGSGLAVDYNQVGMIYLGEYNLKPDDLRSISTDLWIRWSEEELGIQRVVGAYEALLKLTDELQEKYEASSRYLMPIVLSDSFERRLESALSEAYRFMSEMDAKLI